MTSQTLSGGSSQVRIPAWLAVVTIAAVLALWTFVFAHLIGDHVAAVSSARTAGGIVHAIGSS